MKAITRSLKCIALVLAVLCNALAESAPANKRPTVGIALSGGSALGLAHIGVIRYFEEHHIPIDRVGGTSMGGLVGGLWGLLRIRRPIKRRRWRWGRRLGRNGLRWEG